MQVVCPNTVTKRAFRLFNQLQVKLKFPVKYQNNCGTHMPCISALPQQSQEVLVRELQSMDAHALESWAVANRNDITLDLLAYIAQAHSKAELDLKDTLWTLGSKLMAVREGIAPVSQELLQQTLEQDQESSCLARRTDDMQPSECEESTANDPALNESEVSAQKEKTGRPLNSQQSAALSMHCVESRTQTGGKTHGFVSVVQRTASLGLTNDGLTLLQQQAAGLEAVVGASKARSLAEVIGRKQLQPEAQCNQRLFEQDSASRILQLLVSIEDSGERAALLPDAFTPADKASANGHKASARSDREDTEEEEELLSTTPLALLQAIELQLSRLRNSKQHKLAGESAGALLNGGAAFDYLSPDEEVARLLLLREEVMMYWGEQGTMSGEEF